jgi:hypothetical protein
MKCAEHKTVGECYAALHRYQVPRKDNTICDIPLGKLNRDTKCPYVFLKKLIIRLRRTRKPEDFVAFKKLVEPNLDDFLKTLSARWVVSLLDCYVDHGDPLESRNALIAVSIVNCEKMIKTRDLFYTKEPNPSADGSVRHEFADGLDTFITGDADMPANFFKRIRSKIKESPKIHKMFKLLMQRLVEGDSFMHELCELSTDKAFKWPYYKHLLDRKG